MVKTLLRRWRQMRGSKSTSTPIDPAIQRRQELRTQLPDANDAQIDLIASVEPLTMTSPERILALVNAVDHLSQHQIQGDIVECGVWRGGSMVAIAQTLKHHGDTDRPLWLYDTFEGMSQPDHHDVDFLGQDAEQLLSEQDRNDQQSIWCYSPIEQVRAAMSATGYPADHIRFIKGRVEETLPTNVPDRIALLRLDTDWYESTRCELEHLFPKLVDGAILIIDDYGHWEGCRRAVDEYFHQHNLPIFLHRIDYTGRMATIRRAA